MTDMRIDTALLQQEQEARKFVKSLGAGDIITWTKVTSRVMFMHPDMRKEVAKPLIEGLFESYGQVTAHDDPYLIALAATLLDHAMQIVIQNERKAHSAAALSQGLLGMKS